jgi:hypothetical protein
MGNYRHPCDEYNLSIWEAEVKKKTGNLAGFSQVTEFAD